MEQAKKNIRINQQAHDRLTKFCQERHLIMSGAINQIINFGINHYDADAANARQALAKARTATLINRNPLQDDRD